MEGYQQKLAIPTLNKQSPWQDHGDCLFLPFWLAYLHAWFAKEWDDSLSFIGTSLADLEVAYEGNVSTVSYSGVLIIPKNLA